jgi:hypothetical protein
MRVVTSRRKVTDQRAIAEEACDVAIIALNSIHAAAQLALDRNLEGARGMHINGVYVGGAFILLSLALLASAKRMLQRAATTPTQREELSALTMEAQSLDHLFRNCLCDESLLQADATAKVYSYLLCISAINCVTVALILHGAHSFLPNFSNFLNVNIGGFQSGQQIQLDFFTAKGKMQCINQFKKKCCKLSTFPLLRTILILRVFRVFQVFHIFRFR